jgi:glycosyltransferase involved in cell wall biosynthesis
MNGVGRYIAGLTRALSEIDDENHYLLFSSSLRERISLRALPSNFHLIDRRIPVRLLNWTWHRYGIPSLDRLCGTSVDITHSPHPLILPSRRGRSIVTIHDLFFFRYPEQTTAEIRRDYTSQVVSHASRADAILTVSETTAAEIEQELGIDRTRMTVVPNGIDPDVFAPKLETDRQVALLYDLPSRFLLFVGTLEPRKNIPTLVEAVGILTRRGWDGVLLLAGGSGMDQPKIDAAVERLRLGSWIRKLGYVAPKHLPAIYRRAHVLVNPSHWEGFGLPPLEAMVCRVPVVASDIPAHREITGSAALYVSAEDPNSIADGIENVWNDDTLRAKLMERGASQVKRFTWEATARKTLALYKKLGGAA